MPLLAPPTLSLDQQITALREGAGARALEDAVIRVSGGDRLEWLAGMVTNDTKSLRPGEARYAAVVHVKGKILSDAWVYARTDDLLLAVHSRAAASVLAHLEQHVIMEDVELAIAPGARVVSVQGPRAAELAGTEGAFVADRLGRGGVDLVSLDGEPAGTALRAEVASVSEEAWDAARLEAGVPRFGVDFDDQNYVQEANITARAVSFNKGCYVGQEVVCRLEMRGHVRRQLVALALDGETPPAGASVARDGAEVGAVTSAARSPASGQVVALAMVKWDVASSGGEVSVQGRTARIVPRPVA